MTMVRQHPQHAHPPPPPPLLRHNSTPDGLHLHPRPAQYAHPLSRHNSYTAASDSRKPPEHMLRRKTPNGILAAAYDGTSVEDNGAPHATKHILLPVTADASLPYAMKQDLALRSPSVNGPYAHFKQERSADWSPSLYFETGSGRTSQHIPQIDSMLNQIPPLQPTQLPYQMYGPQFGGVMGPGLQSPFAPTVSNDQGPFGPYWPDGAYVPYQPAAMRDPPHPQHHPYVARGFNSGLPVGPAFTQQSYQLNQPMYQNPGAMGHEYPAFAQGHNMNFQSPSLPAHMLQARQDYFAAGQATSVPGQSPVVTPLTEYGPQSPNGQSREKVFAWAHTVYVDLLKFLQSTRKAHMQQNHGRQLHRPHIYPKPPRQPGANLGNDSNGNSRPSTQRRLSSPSISSQSPFQPPSDKASKRPAHYRSASSYTSIGLDANNQRQPWQHAAQQYPMLPQMSGMDPVRTLRRASGSVSSVHQGLRSDVPPSMIAASALEAITKHCEESKWKWIDGMLLGGCLAYALGDYQKAQTWYQHILTLDTDHVEAISNLAATVLALHQKQDAERYWRQAVKLRPSYFEAVEHLIGLLCSDQRGREAVQVIEQVERALRFARRTDALRSLELESERPCSGVSESPELSDVSDRPLFEFEGEDESIFKDLDELPGSDQPGFGSSGYAIPGCDNGRILALVHAKGNMLYALGNNTEAAKAFENAVLIGAGTHANGIGGLIKRILSVVGYEASERSPGGRRVAPSSDPILLPPDSATRTAHLCFPPHGQLPGLAHVASDGLARKAAISTTSNSLLSLAKIFQDGMATNSPRSASYQSNYGVPPSKPINVSNPAPYPQIPGLVPGSGIALALAYYYFGLQLDKRHAHLYTNLGSLLKDIGQLDVAISMYEQAVSCDQNFDIALANLANAVKDKGRISDAIVYYKRAVKSSPDFAEAVCGLANALNSVCGWNGRGGIAEGLGARDRWHVDENGMLLDARIPGASSSGWIHKVVKLVEKQLADGEGWGRGTMDERFVKGLCRPFVLTSNTTEDIKEKQASMVSVVTGWRGQKWEGARIVRLAERAIKRLTWQWYQDRYVTRKDRSLENYSRPQLPAALTVPAAPTVLPFHTFTCPMSAEQIRMISQRNGLRISCSTLRAPWLPPTVFQPPAPPKPYLKVGYVSSDFNNHPLAHLMQSVFGLHDTTKVKAYCYATTASDGSEHRKQIEKESPVFHDANNWSAERLVKQITKDGIHILINLNGYTRGARNEVFAARAAPIQMSFMGFAGTLGAEWCDYLLADDTAVPPDTLRQWRRNVDMEDALVDENSGGSDKDWIYAENIIFCRDTFFCCDHRQSAPDAQGRQPNWEEEQERRWAMRKEIFPQLRDDAIILGNFNQLYKIEPTTFRTWLRILQRLPKAILWLLRFPDLGETNLKQTALMWAGPEVANRVIFTDVAQKHQHISRARVCDLFLDTPECNAHTTAADVLWSGTPLLTLPRYKYKMCSRMAASILKGALPKSPEGTQAAKDLIASSDEDYEEKAVRLGSECVYQGHRATGRLSELRRMLYKARWNSALYDTKRWVRDLEQAYEIAWRKWERGEGGDIWLQDSKPRVEELADAPHKR
ncbi:glycosyl transferase family 41-domain-containing protein [Boeremia exigua]|uniref:glycosyl transferase family 41-domain-containing protein n=1 Tax=Boeremia exigua TaxID=749465 RepID=UPI001E8EE300|nr:glycosyl transferase family 41-domain-containing protein [Boeremia exigua]KAH6629656.1 glycosyl transferase family 41-domain-containing protein [Boeremia exigua]